MNLDLLFVCKTDKQIQIGLPVIWTGHARLKRHYVKAFYISLCHFDKIFEGATHISCGNIKYSSAGVRNMT